MPSLAKKKLIENLGDVERLQSLHSTVGGNSKGRRWNVECLNKASLVLICGAWEAYLEDLCEECANFLLLHGAYGGLSAQANGLRINYLATNPGATQVQILLHLGDNLWVENKFNTPKSAKVMSLFDRVLAIPDVTTTWRWKKSSITQTCSRLDRYVRLRGEIAHRSSAPSYVRKPVVSAFSELVMTLSDKLDATVKSHVEHQTPGATIF